VVTVSTGAALDMPLTVVSLMVSREAPVTESVIRDPLGLLIKGLRTESSAFF